MKSSTFQHISKDSLAICISFKYIGNSIHAVHSPSKKSTSGTTDELME